MRQDIKVDETKNRRRWIYKPGGLLLTQRRSEPTLSGIGEEMAEMLAKEIDNTTVLNIKLNNSGNGFDVMQFENGLENTTKIRLFESKPLNSNSVVLPNTGMGTQMGDRWINANIQKMIRSTNADVKNIGNILDTNFVNIERYVFTVDKDLEQIIIFKLDIFN